MTVCMLRWLAVVLCTALSPLTAQVAEAASFTPTSRPVATINGDVVYRERMALPPAAVVWVTLHEQKPHQPSKRVTEMSFPTTGRSVPLPFALPVPPKINAKAAYTLTARIELDGETLFGGAQPLAVRFPVTPETRHTLLLHRVIMQAPAPETNAAPIPSARLTQARWKLTQLGNIPSQVFDNQQEPQLTFQPAEASSDVASVSGSDGCNNLMGTYTLSASNGHGVPGIVFGHLGATMRLCPQGGEQAQTFAQALANTNGYRLIPVEDTGDTLELLHNITILARFQRVAL